MTQYELDGLTTDDLYQVYDLIQEGHNPADHCPICCLPGKTALETCLTVLELLLERNRRSIIAAYSTN